MTAKPANQTKPVPTAMTGAEQVSVLCALVQSADLPGALRAAYIAALSDATAGKSTEIRTTQGKDEKMTSQPIAIDLTDSELDDLQGGGICDSAFCKIEDIKGEAHGGGSRDGKISGPDALLVINR